MSFQSSFIGKEASGFHDISFKYNTMYDADFRKDMYAMSCCQVARPKIQAIIERMMKGQTASRFASTQRLHKNEIGRKQAS